MSEPKLDITTQNLVGVTNLIHTMCEVMGKVPEGQTEFLAAYQEVEGMMFDEGLYPEGYDVTIDAQFDTAKPFTLKAEIISYLKRNNISEITITERD